MKDIKDGRSRLSKTHETPKSAKSYDGSKLNKTSEQLKKHKSSDAPKSAKEMGSKRSLGAEGVAKGERSKHSKSLDTPRDKQRKSETPREKTPKHPESSGKESTHKTQNAAKDSRGKVPDSPKDKPGGENPAVKSPETKHKDKKDEKKKPSEESPPPASNNEEGDNNNNNRLDQYGVLCQIGKGACGDVFLVRSKENKKLYALKKIQLDESRKTRTREAVEREARILSGLKHPHIVTYLESFFDEKQEHLCIIQDYCDGGTLDDKIREAAAQNAYFQEKQIIHWFLQTAMAVRYMHSKRVLHRDLKTSNVFLNKSCSQCKLGDFGIAKNMNHTIDVASTCVGTPCYLSPEMCQDIPYSSKADVWALGCLLYEMVALKPAFDANNLVSLFYKIVKEDIAPLPDEYSDELKDLVRLILVKQPEKRPSARGILALPFMRAELLKFIEEKEHILQQRRNPMPKGSRPYSTPVLIGRTVITEPDNLGMGGSQQRAFSCRPAISTRKENSILSSARRSSRNGRVSVIIEESEESEDKNLKPDQLMRLHKENRAAENKAQQTQAPSGDQKENEPMDTTAKSRKPGTPNKKPGTGSRRSGHAGKRSGTGSRKPVSAVSCANTELTMGGESIEYDYIDDFDDSSSLGSDLDEDIPEEIPGRKKEHDLQGTTPLTQTFEIPEIPEELVDGKEASDEDYDLDFEEEEVNEEISEIVNVAREAHGDIDSQHVEEDETIVDEENGSPSTSRIIKKHMLDTLGEERYEQVKKYCEGQNVPEAELRQLEKEVGTENLKTFYLMAEVLSKTQDLQVSKRASP